MRRRSYGNNTFDKKVMLPLLNKQLAIDDSLSNNCLLTSINEKNQSIFY